MDTDAQPALPGTSLATSVTPREKERRKQFAAAMTKLAMQLRQTDPDRVTLAAYWEVLNGLPLRAVEAACRALARTATFFPTSAEIYKAATESMHADQQAAMRLRNIPSDYARCHSCSDTRWIPMTCSGTKAECGRRRDHLPHDYAIPCTMCTPATASDPTPEPPAEHAPHWQETHDD